MNDSDHDRRNRSARLKQARIDAGFETMEVFAEAVGQKFGTYKGHETGHRGFDGTTCLLYARALHVSPEWLMFGQKKATRGQIEIRGLVGAGHDVYQIEENRLGYEPLPGGKLVGYAIRGDSQLPRYENADLIVIDPERKTAPSEALYHEAICQLKDGRQLIKTVHRGSKEGLYTLISHNAPPIEDVGLEWAIPFKRRIILVD